jgi:hypothetical protein
MSIQRALISAAILLASLPGCHKTTDDVSAIWTSKSELLGSALARYDSVLLAGDTSAALIAAIDLAQASPLVAWAQYNGYNGISVGFTDSTPGVILISPASAETVDSRKQKYSVNRSEEVLGDIGLVSAPTKNGAVFFGPWIYKPIEGPWHTKILGAMSDNLPNVGFPNPSPRQVLGSQVTPDELASISGCGVIDFEAHGCAYPTEQDLREVLMVLTVRYDPPIPEKYRADVQAGLLFPDVYTTEDGREVSSYGVTPKFIADHNRDRWEKDRPLIWGGFCYSALGSWQTEMVAANANAYVGWDWAVWLGADCEYACSLYCHMCRTPVSDPFQATLAAYFAKYSPEYYNGKRMVHLCWAGDPLTTFQDPVPEGWRVGPYNPVFDFIAGAWGPNTLDLSFRIWGQEFPLAGLEVRNPDQLQVGVPVTPDMVSVMLPTGEQYTSLMYQDKCEVVFTKIDKPESPGVGSVSGVLAGYVYDLNEPGEPIFVPVSCRFENISVYPGKVDVDLGGLPASRKERR